MRTLGTLLRIVVLAVAVLTVSVASVMARQASPSGGWISSGAMAGNAGVVMSARSSRQVATAGGFGRWRSRGGVRRRGRCLVPSLSGYRLGKAGSLLRRAGCRLARSHRHREDARLVVAQSVRPGTWLARGAIVSVKTVSPRVAEKRCILSPAQRMVTADSQFVLVSEPGRPKPPIEGRTLYLACAYGGSGMHAVTESYFLNQGAGGGGRTSEQFVAAGQYLAWQSGFYPGGGMSISTMTVLDAFEDKVIANQTIATTEAINRTEADTIQLVLDPEGHAAWRAKISTFAFGASPQVTEALEVFGEGGQLVVLESGPLGSFGALSFGAAGTLHWSSNGSARIYMFPATGGA